MRRSRMSRKPTGNVRTKYFALKGGLNLVDAPLAIPNGMVLGAINYELDVRDGYRRIDGYERFDGQNSPTDASYWILNFDAGDSFYTADAAPEIGARMEGVTSGAIGELGLIMLSSGAWATNDAAGYMVVFQITGTFQDNETINFLGLNDGFDSGFDSGFG